MSDPDTQTSAPKRGRKAAKRGFGLLVVLVVAGAIGVTSILGRQISAPNWLREEITTRLNDQITEAEVSFGDVSIVLERNWVPRVMLRDVRIADAKGEKLAAVADADGTLALRPLLRGEVQPGTIRLSGATLRLRRSETGDVGVAVGDSPASVEEAPSFAALISQLDDVFMQPDLMALTAIEANNLTIRYEDARARQAWTVDGGRLRLTREGDDLQLRGDFALLGNRGFATTLEMNYQSVVGELGAEFGLSFEDMPARDIARQSPALAWLDALQAPISGALRAVVEDDGALGPLNATLQIGEGVLQPTDETRPIPFSSAQTYFTYDPVTQSMQFDEVFLDSKWVTARAEGKAFLVGLEQGLPSELWTQFQVSELRANPAGLYDEPVVIEGVTMDSRLKLDPFELTLGEMSLSDQGQRLVLNGTLEALPEGWDLALDGRMDGLTPARLVELWPEEVSGNTRNWIRDNVVSADLSNIKLAVRSHPESRPDLFLGFDFKGLETRFMKKMPHIKDADGSGSLYNTRFVISASRGHVVAPQGGRVDVSGTSFVVPSVQVKLAPARVYLRAKSTVTAALSLLDNEPFRFLTKAGQPVTLADGQAEIEGQLDFLLKQKLETDEVAFDVRAVARQVRSETLVEGRVLAAPRLDVLAKNGSLEIAGEGRIGRVPASGSWRTDIGKTSDGSSRLEGTIELSERFADEFSIGLPPGSISGAGQGVIGIDFAKGQPGRFTLSSNLAGVGLRLQALGWALSRGGTGNLEVAGSLGSPPDISRISLNAGGLRADGNVTLKANGQLDRASFSRVRAGTWLDAPVDLIGRGAGATPAVRVNGGTIDLRQTSLAGEGGGNRNRSRGGPVTLRLDRLQISEGIALTGFSADLDMANGANGRFTGKVNNGATVNGTVIPQGNRSAFRIQSKNAGGVLASAGLLKNARNGDMDLILRPATAAGTYNGTLNVRQLRLKDAPALAALLNALSVVGILEQLAGDGIHFSQVEADFQLGPKLVTLTQGSAVGASMGISMEGYYFMDRGEMDMQGVFSPIYLVNAVGGIFSRKGEGLIGFNYRLNGPAAAPQVRVNPLSLLTPGMFRDIFREPPPKVQR